MLRTIILADIGNLFHCVGKKFNQRRLDYGKVLKWIQEAKPECEIRRAIGYGVKIKDDSVKFFKSLDDKGWEVDYIEPFMWTDTDTGVQKPRGLDRTMAMGCRTFQTLNAHSFDYYIFLTSNPVFAPLFKLIGDYGPKVHVIGPVVPHQLRDVVPEWTEWCESDVDYILES